MQFPRESGILLHPTSLPGNYGIGEIGPQSWRFADTLAEMGQHLWQILPLGPTGYGDSPYQLLSTFAGNHLLISFDLLVQDKLLTIDELQLFPDFPKHTVDFGPVIRARTKLLRLVCEQFEDRATEKTKKAFQDFSIENASWLDDYALFIALKNAHTGRAWTEWEPELVRRDPRALQLARKKYHKDLEHVKILQYLFHSQWKRLVTYCHQKNIKIIGDMPLFVAHDSADVWANPDLFYVDAKGKLIVQSGVPPCYFSKKGQLWGNPLYRWIVHHNSNYKWWAGRIRKLFELVDIVRIDHFCGFVKYWEVLADKKTAVNGLWVEGPAESVFEALNEQLGDLPIIAEDLGEITQNVEMLRDKYHFPGMRVLQYAFGNDPNADEFLPDHYPKNCVVYTGTHDNDTTVGWFHSKPGKGSTRTRREIEAEQRTVLNYLKTDGKEIHWDLIALALRSNGNTAIIPLQDIMGLDSSARMNLPGTCGGNNWRWRFSWDMLLPEMKERMYTLASDNNRIH